MGNDNSSMNRKPKGGVTVVKPNDARTQNPKTAPPSSDSDPKQRPPVVTMEVSAKSFSGAKHKMTRRDPRSSSTVYITDALTNVREDYHINPKEIGHGHYGVVRKCMHRETKQWYAIKSIRKSKVGKVEVLKREIDILRQVHHPNIIELKEVHEDRKYLHLITELCTGGELFDRIISKTESDEGHFSERDAAQLVYTILDAIRYCHDVKGIVHRDLKPENFLYATPAEDAPIKIIDFGLSRHDSLQVMKTKVGTPYYVAPEVLRREYTKSCDIWSIGVITYILLCGYPPFYGESDNQIFDSVKTARFDFPSPEWDDISKQAKDFICKLLKKDPSQRLTAAQAMQHEWLQSQNGNGNTKTIVRTGSIRGANFQRYMAMQKLKKAVMSNIAAKLTKSEVGSLGDIFKSIDKDGDGMLSLGDLEVALQNEAFPPELQNMLADLRDDLQLSEQDTLNWKDFLAATMDKKLAMREDKVRMAFDSFKKSNDDCLLVSDLVDIFGGEAQAAEVMGFIDADGDGRISFEEFSNAVAESMRDDLEMEVTNV